MTALEMAYVVGIQRTTTVWKPGEAPKPAPARKDDTGRPRKLLQRDTKNQPVSVKELSLSLRMCCICGTGRPFNHGCNTSAFKVGYETPSNAPNTHACPYRFDRVIPSTWPFLIIC